MIDTLSRELHPVNTGLMQETEVCPWTLFLTMSLTLLKGLMPHVPQLLPLVVSDPEMRERAEATFMSAEFQDNIEEYFVDNIKADIQAPLNRQIIKSSETIMYMVKIFNNFFDYFTSGAQAALNGEDKTSEMPRHSGITVGGFDLAQIFDFAKTIYNLA